jgi:hypothetical protein
MSKLEYLLTNLKYFIQDKISTMLLTNYPNVLLFCVKFFQKQAKYTSHPSWPTTPRGELNLSPTRKEKPMRGGELFFSDSRMLFPINFFEEGEKK